MATTDERRRDWSAYTRAGWIVLFLWQGSHFTAREVARLTGLTLDGAYKMMRSLENDFPIVKTEGKYHWLRRDE